MDTRNCLLRPYTVAMAVGIIHKLLLKNEWKKVQRQLRSNPPGLRAISVSNKFQTKTENVFIYDPQPKA